MPVRINPHVRKSHEKDQNQQLRNLRRNETLKCSLAVLLPLLMGRFASGAGSCVRALTIRLRTGGTAKAPSKERPSEEVLVPMRSIEEPFSQVLKTIERSALNVLEIS